MRRLWCAAQVQKQSVDLADMLDVASLRAMHLLFMEDDLDLCKNGLAAMLYVIDKVCDAWACRCASRRSVDAVVALVSTGDALLQ